MRQDPFDPGISTARKFLQVTQIKFVVTPMKAGQVHGDPETEFVGEFELFVRQKFVNPALSNVTSDGIEPVRLESDESLCFDVVFNIREAAGGCHQSIHARLGILPHLFQAPAVVCRHVNVPCRRSQHQKMSLATGIKSISPLPQRGKTSIRPSV